jgi:hypothetical protein
VTAGSGTTGGDTGVAAVGGGAYGASGAGAPAPFGRMGV